MKKIRHMNHTFITGTMILTASGVLTRIIGFFYKIFLSRLIGASGLGLYQLVAPIAALGFALTTSGIQTAISRYVSISVAENKQRNAIRYLVSGIAVSMTLSMTAYFILSAFADKIAGIWLMEPDAAPLLKIIALTFMPCCIHACINGYYYGIKKTAVPSACQLMEQSTRVFVVWIMYMICKESGKTFDITFAVWGLVAGEAASTLLSLACFRPMGLPKTGITYISDIMRMAAPLTAGRAAISIFAASENALIPARLKDFGYTSSDALAIYGILTGMSLSVVMFPSVLTNSASVLLMPTVSEAHAQGNVKLITKAIRRSFTISLLLGFICIAGFTMTGSFIGNVIFDNALAGSFIKTLAWICPFMYINATLNSILNGLGRPALTFIQSIISCSIRIMFVQFAIPQYGIKGYLSGIVISHIISASLAAAAVYRFKNEIE